MAGRWGERYELAARKVWIDSSVSTSGERTCALLIDVVDELRRLNTVFACNTVQRGFAALSSLAKIERARERAKNAKRRAAVQALMKKKRVKS